MRSNPIRFTGMASGMDTDSIVRDLMRPQQYKIDNQKKQQALLQLKQDAWKDMNKKLVDFHTKFTDKMRLASTFNKTTTTSSNESAMSINSDTRVPEGTHTFNITQLAESASAVGQVNKNEGLTEDPTLKELMGRLTVPKELAIKVNGKEIKIDVIETDTLSKIAEKMNEKLKDEKTGFTASYDKKNGGFFVSSTATGADQTIEFSSKNAKGAKLFQRMGLTTGNKIPGKDAEYTYNEAKFTSSTNKIEINGIKATLKSANTGPVTISSERDPDAIYEWVKDFITEYNTLIDEINLKIDTKPGKDIMPLTAQERESMSESEIKLWEGKLNNSLFYQDQELTNFVTSARRILSQVFDVNEGEHNSLASLGIVTGSWQEKGKLYIEGDEDNALHSDKPNKLKNAIAADPNKVAELFQKLGKDLYADHNEKLTSTNKLKSFMNFYNDKVMTDKMKDFDKQIKTLEDRMYRMENTYYAKFAAMEKMLSTLNNQSSWLAQQFGGY